MNALVFTYKLEDIEAMAVELLTYFDSKTILFKGEMGAGKTTLINALLKAMKSEDIATSPTFSIVNEYKIPNDTVYHFDFYRINSLEEAYDFGIEAYLSTDAWLFMEWPDRVAELLPDDHQTLTITALEDHRRSLKLTINKKRLTQNNAMTETKF